MRKLLFVLVACFAFAINAFAAVNINSASQAELESINGVGPAKAKAIIDYRAKNGAFKSVDDLSNVKGFGKKSVDSIRKDVTISGSAAAGPAKTEKPKTVGNETAAATGKTADAKAAKEDKPAKPDSKATKKDDKKK